MKAIREKVSMEGYVWTSLVVVSFRLIELLQGHTGPLYLNFFFLASTIAILLTLGRIIKSDNLFFASHYGTAVVAFVEAYWYGDVGLFYTNFFPMACIWISISLSLLDTLSRVGHRVLERPNVNAAFMFYIFMTPQNADAIVGDFEQRYPKIREKFGKVRADLWYWTQTITSVGPIAWEWMKKVIVKLAIPTITWGIGKNLMSETSWLASAAELWKRIGL